MMYTAYHTAHIDMYMHLYIIYITHGIMHHVLLLAERHTFLLSETSLHIHCTLWGRVQHLHTGGKAKRVL